MSHHFPRLEFGALAVAALAAVYGIWLAVGLPPLPLGIHMGRSPLDVPNVVQLASGPLRGPQPTSLPLTITPGTPVRHRVEAPRNARSAIAATRKGTLPPGPAAPAPPTPRSPTVGDSVRPPVVPVASPQTPQLQPTAPVPAVTVPALPQTPPAPQLPVAPQVPSPLPQTPGLPPLL